MQLRTPAAAALVLLLSVVLASIAGCGDGAEPSAPTAPAPAGTTSGTAAVADPPSAPVQTATLPIADATSRSSVTDNPAGWPPIEFEPAEMHFGTLPPEGTGDGTVKIWNVGTAPLRIMFSRTSCGCTTVTNLGGRVIAPGTATEFDVAMKMKSGLGEKKEGIRMVFDGYGDGLVTYYFTAEVSLPVRAVPPHITATESLSGTVALESIDGTPFRVLRAHGAPPIFADGFDPARDEPRAAYTLAWDLSPFVARGEVPWFFVVETDHPGAPLVDLRVRHDDATRPARVTGRPWQPKDQRVLAGIVRPGEPFEVESWIEYGGNAAPVEATASVASGSPRLSAQLVRAWREDQGLHYRIRLRVLDAAPGLLYESIVLRASGFEETVRVVARVAAE